MNLVIVESPAKGRTIKNILGANFKVLASFGHVRDLPEKKLGIDTRNNFEPEYIIPAKSRKTIKLLKEEASKADNLYLATDYDREGEAIAWHITEAVGLGNSKSHATRGGQTPTAEGKAFNSKVKRIAFHEITKPAVLEAIKKPRAINMDLVNAQQGRRVLDRLVGYKLSPFLWRKVASGLSAGRVQSVAVRLVVEREQEIRKFTPEEFWLIVAELSKKDDKSAKGRSASGEKTFKTQLVEINEKRIEKLSIKNQAQAQKILDKLKGAIWQVRDLKTETKNRYPAPPFTTSTLQQEAAQKFHFSPKQTMKIAQGLYEDGLITYMRTDSVQISSLAISQARKVINKKYGDNYLSEKPRIYRTKTIRAQEAHEAIRPTNLERCEILGMENSLRLYNLIWQRMIASQMHEASFFQTKVHIKAKDYGFEASGLKMRFDGFLKIYQTEEIRKDQFLPELKKNEKLDLKKLEKNQRFTEPPSRYSEATLIRELEKRGIGRPSTYAPTLSTIIDRGYVEKTQGKLTAKEIGEIVTDLLVKHFPEIVDYNFTAKMEEDLDQIALGRREWQKVISEFYEPFSKELIAKSKEVSKQEITEEETDKKCPKCGKNLKIKLGRYGKFLACSGFPECKYTAPILENLPASLSREKCPKCDKKMLIKEGKFGPFLACEGYPKCKFTKNLEVVAKIKCPNCGGKIVRKTTRKGRVFWGCVNFPKCKTAYWDEPLEKKCPKCGGVLTLNEKTKLLKCSGCSYSTK